jgi:hypothetical protein
MDTQPTVEQSILIREFLLGQVNSQFELWLTITFAVIIASYIAGHNLSRSLRQLIASLYLLVSILLLAVAAGAVSFAREMGGTSILEVPSFLGYTIALLRPTVWILGTITTIIFIFSGNRTNQDGKPTDFNDA